VTEQLTGTVSLGAAVFASVLFASGMPTEFDVVSGFGLDVRQWQMFAAEHNTATPSATYVVCKRSAHRFDVVSFQVA
jgi:hypothetical protein